MSPCWQFNARLLCGPCHFRSALVRSTTITRHHDNTVCSSTNVDSDLWSQLLTFDLLLLPCILSIYFWLPWYCSGSIICLSVGVSVLVQVSKAHLIGSVSVDYGWTFTTWRWCVSECEVPWSNDLYVFNCNVWLAHRLGQGVWIVVRWYPLRRLRSMGST